MLTDKQARFAKLIADGVPQTEAALAAGYANSSPNALAVTASRLMRHPEIRRAAFEQREARLAGPLGQKAMATLESIIEDETAPAPARVKAAVWILEATGHGLQAKLGAARLGLNDGNKPLSQLTVEELESFVQGLESTEKRLKAASGKVIEVGAGEVGGD